MAKKAAKKKPVRKKSASKSDGVELNERGQVKRKFKGFRPPPSTEGVPNHKTLDPKYKEKLLKDAHNDEFFIVAIETMKVGRPLAFDSPDALLSRFMQYAEWSRNNPWVKHEAKSTKTGIKMVEVPIGRPFTIMAFSLFCGVTSEYFTQFKINLKKNNPEHADEFSRVIYMIEEACRRQKFEGAAVNAFNANLMSYDLGIRKDAPSGGTVGFTIIVGDNKQKELLEEVMAKLAALDKEGTEESINAG